MTNVLDEGLTIVLDHVRQAKEMAEWEDMVPTLFCFRADRIEVAVLAVPGEYLGAAVIDIVKASPCEMVFLINDVFATTVRQEQAADIARGHLVERWYNDDRDGISEAISVVGVSATEVKVVTQCYDAILRMWDEPVISDNPQGVAADILTRAFRASRASLQ